MTKQQLQDKRILKKRIQDYLSEKGKNRRVLAVQLNGFTHTIFFDTNKKGSKSAPGSIHILTYSDFMNNDLAEDLKTVFAGYPNYAYQNSAIEFVYIHKQRV